MILNFIDPLISLLDSLFPSSSLLIAKTSHYISLLVSPPLVVFYKENSLGTRCWALGDRGNFGSIENSKCYGLNCVSSKKSYVETLTLNVTVFGDKASWEVIKVNKIIRVGLRSI